MTFMCLLVPFNVKIFKKIFRMDLELPQEALNNSGSKIVHLPQPGIFFKKLPKMIFFFGKTIKVIFMYILAPFI